jgi:hypothetical protein
MKPKKHQQNEKRFLNSIKKQKHNRFKNNTLQVFIFFFQKKSIFT